MKAVKGNKVYTIDETQKKFYEESGYDILDEEGCVIAYGKGKTVPYGEYIALKKEKEALEEDNARMKDLLKEKHAEETEKPAGKSGRASKVGE